MKYALIVSILIFANSWVVAQDETKANSAVQKVDQAILIVVGADGTPEFGEQFSAWADQWESTLTDQSETSKQKTSRIVKRLGDDAARELSDRDRLKGLISEHGNAAHELWVVLIGHGTDDRKVSNFNLRGPDVSATELAAWLAPVTAHRKWNM